MFAGLNNGGAAYGVSTFSNTKWENFTTAGYGTRPPIGEEITVAIRVYGSRLELFVNGVLVVQGTYYIRRSQITFLINSKEPVEVEIVSVEKTESVAFVVMQFTPEFDELYREVIAPTCESFGLKAVRGDDIYNNGLIIDDITKSIRESTVVIADITPNNPNVFYEVGFAHGINKPTILLADRGREKLPFDISGFRTIFYDNTIGGKSNIEQRLQQHLKGLLSV